MTDGTPSPAAGSDAAGAPVAAEAPAPATPAAESTDTGEVMVAATRASDRGGRPFWAHLDSPFTAGLLLTIGGLVAILLGIAVTNIATILIYIALAMFAALGLDPVLRWFERHNVKRPWAITIVFLILGVIATGVILLVVPTLINQVSSFITGIPSMISDFQKSDVYATLEGIFGTGLNTITSEIQSFITNPSNIAAISGGLLKIGAGIAAAVSGG